MWGAVPWLQYELHEINTLALDGLHRIIRAPSPRLYPVAPRFKGVNHVQCSVKAK